MNQKKVKKLRQLYQRDANKIATEQANYLRISIKPCPFHPLLFPLWRFGAKFYFTQEHIDNVTESYERLKKQSTAK